MVKRIAFIEPRVKHGVFLIQKSCSKSCSPFFQRFPLIQPSHRGPQFFHAGLLTQVSSP